VLRLPDDWVWDSWLAAADGGEHHLFFLRAPRALRDPARRHDHTAIGHATSADLRRWTRQADALVRPDTPAWDDLALWTGSVARVPGGPWRMFYTGRSHADRGLVQRIGTAVSDDLATWTREGPLLEADPRWYEKLDLATWHQEAWRDPYVVRDPDGDGWHMLITARAATGDPAGRGVIGHARSDDLITWKVGPPLTHPAGFGHMEVPRVVRVDGQPILMFSCLPEDTDGTRSPAGGVWVAPGETLLGPWDLDNAVALDHPSLYATNFVRDDAHWAVLGFRDTEDGEFIGEITDPIPIERHGANVRLLGVSHSPTVGLPDSAKARLIAGRCDVSGRAAGPALETTASG
jgi:beta-fructofuranosidase